VQSHDAEILDDERLAERNRRLETADQPLAMVRRTPPVA